MSRLLSPLAAAAIVGLAALTPAKAMTPAPAAGMSAAIDAAKMTEEVRYVCRHRWRSSRRVCWWQPPRRHYRPYYRPYRHHYRPHRFYRPRYW